MNTMGDNLPINADRLDLLVDGELDEAQRRALLSRLDDQPGGWRRCALAFLEAQTWRQALGALAREEPGAVPPSARKVRGRSWKGRVGTLLAMAPSFLVALVLGTQWQQAGQRGHETARPPGEMLVGAEPAEKAAGQPNLARVVPAGSPQRADATAGPWQMVTVAVPDGSRGQPRAIQLPAIERDYLDEKWLQDLPAAMPPDVLEALRRTGHQVRQERELLPLQMKDGRRLVVPVDKVEVHYVGNAAYQ